MPVYKDPERGTWFVELRYKDYSSGKKAPRRYWRTDGGNRVFYFAKG